MRKVFKKLTVAVLGLVVLGSILSTAQAGIIYSTPVGLDLLLIPGNQFQNGDKLFTFDPNGYSSSVSGTAVAVPASAITIAPFTDLDGNLGIKISSGFIAPTGSTQDETIIYTVTTTDDHLITDAHLTGNPAVVGGTGTSTVQETILPVNEQLSIFDVVPNGPPVLSDVAFFTPTKTLQVFKDILLAGGTGSATLSIITQTFSQTGKVVPEPSTLLLGSFGALIGIGCMVRRRREAVA